MTDLCESCHRVLEGIWFAPSPLWEHVAGSEWDGVYCMACFTRMAEEKGLVIHWRARLMENVEGLIREVDEEELEKRLK